MTVLWHVARQLAFRMKDEAVRLERFAQTCEDAGFPATAGLAREQSYRCSQVANRIQCRWAVTVGAIIDPAAPEYHPTRSHLLVNLIGHYMHRGGQSQAEAALLAAATITPMLYDTFHPEDWNRMDPEERARYDHFENRCRNFSLA